MRKLLLSLAVSLAPILAAPIAVDNHSFETTNPLLDCSGVGAGCQFNEAQVPGWTMNGTGGSFLPGNPANNNVFDFIPDGSVVGYNNGGSLSQTVGATVQLGLTYTLQVEIGNRRDTCCVQTGTIALVIGGATVIAGVGGTAADGGWTTHTVEYVAQAADVGSSITIRLLSSGLQGNFDNVRLSDSGSPSSAVPEPGSAAMLLLGLAGVVRYRRSALLK